MQRRRGVSSAAVGGYGFRALAFGEPRNDNHNAVLAVPFIRTGPVGRPVGEPVAGSSVISKIWLGLGRGR